VNRWHLAAGAAWRFARQHGIGRASRLGVTGLITLGPRGLVRRAAADIRQSEDDERYQRWLAAHMPSDPERERLRQRIARWAVRPRISIITPVFNAPADGLRRCAASVRGQIYPDWEWCVCDDGSTEAETRAILASLSDDARVRIVRSPANAGIVSASNAALALATGEFVAFLDQDDELSVEALAEIVRPIAEDPAIDLVYSDEDKIDRRGARVQPHFKPDWSPELLRSCMYVSHLTVMRRRLVEAAGGFRAGTDGAQDYDLLLRASLQSPRVAHVPNVLYHWRMADGSAANSQLQKPWAIAAGRRVLEEDARRRGAVEAIESAGAAGHYRVRVRAGRSQDVRLVQTAAAPSAAIPGTEPYVLFCAPSRRPPAADAIAVLRTACSETAVGVVGGFVLQPDGTIDSAGIVLTRGIPLPAFHGEPVWARGHLSNITDVRNCSAVSGALLMTRRDVLERVGIDTEAAGLWDIDYCLRVRAAGLRVAVTPHARIRMTTARSPASPRDLARLQSVWGAALDRDPYYNQNFDQCAATFRLPAPPVPGA
jgi:GT2 family glycosyltransferase